MSTAVTIKSINNDRSELVIHPEKADALKLGHKIFAHLSFGIQKHYANVRLDPEIPAEHLMLSQNLIQKMHLPDYLAYEIRVDQNEIRIGPHIGLLVSHEDRKLTASKLNNMLSCMKDYSKLNGSVVVFALNKVDKQNLSIEGYGYNPNRKGWQWGVFPYPSAIYRTIGLSLDWKNHFLSIIGDKLFNNRYFGKWETVQWFSKDPALGANIPSSVLYHSPRDVFGMLEKFPEIYIKPVLGLQGRGIVRMSSENRRFVLKCRENGVNTLMTFTDQNEAGAYLQNRLRRGRYVIQQAIRLLEYKGSIIDFRCVIQKNQSGAWECRAVIGRAGVQGSVVSNISSGGTAFPAGNILKKALGASEETIRNLKKEIAGFAVAVGDKLNECGINCGTLGLDIGLDDQGFIWLIEINNRDPDPGIALDVRNLELYYTLKSGPLFYAKYLAGFKNDVLNHLDNEPSGL